MYCDCNHYTIIQILKINAKHPLAILFIHLCSHHYSQLKTVPRDGAANKANNYM